MPPTATSLYVEELLPALGDDAPLIVVVHGSMDRHRSFLRLCTKLRDCRLLVYDRRGYNRSRDAVPPAVHMVDHANDLLGLLAERPADAVFGHSYGGDVALAAAQKRPDLIRSLVVYEPPMPWLGWWNRPDQGLSMAGDWTRDPGDVAEAFVRRVIGEDRFERLPKSARQDMRSDGPALVAELSSLRRDPPPFDPADVPVPVVVAHGTESGERQERGADWLVERLPRPELAVVQGADHMAHLTHAGDLAVLIRHAVELAGSAPKEPASPAKVEEMVGERVGDE